MQHDQVAQVAAARQIISPPSPHPLVSPVDEMPVIPRRLARFRQHATDAVGVQVEFAAAARLCVDLMPDDGDLGCCGFAASRGQPAFANRGPADWRVALHHLARHRQLQSVVRLGACSGPIPLNLGNYIHNSLKCWDPNF